MGLYGDTPEGLIGLTPIITPVRSCLQSSLFSSQHRPHTSSINASAFVNYFVTIAPDLTCTDVVRNG